jgi:hypothetical protein
VGSRTGLWRSLASGVGARVASAATRRTEAVAGLR